ncbi:MAG: hypothetical protein ACR2QH_12125, partial [Geminicoccaceae bacterium]
AIWLMAQSSVPKTKLSLPGSPIAMLMGLDEFPSANAPVENELNSTHNVLNRRLGIAAPTHGSSVCYFLGSWTPSRQEQLSY